MVYAQLDGADRLGSSLGNGLLFDKYDSQIGRETIFRSWNMFSQVIKKLELIYGLRPFNQQSVQSLVEMFLLVSAYSPRSVVELGAGTRSSTVALASAAAALPRCQVLSIDINPGCFHAFARKHFSEFEFAPVNDLQMNIADLAYNSPIRSLPRPIFLLLDAHDDDIPGVKVFDNVRDHLFPILNKQLVAVHDCSVFPSDADPTVPGTHVKTRHFSGRVLVGYREVVPLVEWMNRTQVDFYRPGDELLSLGFPGDDSSLIYFSIP